MEEIGEAETDARTSSREPLEAVGWMLGPEIIGRLAKILGKRRDPRGWMPRFDGFVHDEHRSCDGRLEYRGAERTEAEIAHGIGRVEAQRRATEAEPELAGQPSPPERDTVWFDYISDAGDSGGAMYAVAVACLADFDADSLPESIPFGQEHRLELRIKPAQGPRAKLPRGQFLFIGGDTAYHVADAPTIRARVEEPFRWADEDLTRIDALSHSYDVDPRLYGIPGNHDWYDNLDGYRLAFQRDAVPNVGADEPELKPGVLNTFGRSALVALQKMTGSPARTPPALDRGLSRFLKTQRASYVGIQLPHGWQLWGLDIDQPLDEEQKRYFVSLMPNGEPTRLIFCTPSPPVAFRAVVPSKNHAKAVKVLKLAPAYLDANAPEARPLPPGSLRLDLSGDMHHYARYAESSSYMSVISGLGGAFHHPSFTQIGKREPKALYPKADESRDAVGERLLSRKALFVGSWIRALPIVFTLILGFAATAKGGIAWITSQIFTGRTDNPFPIPDPAMRFASAGLLTATLVATVLLLLAAVKTFDATFEAQSKNPLLKTDFFPALGGPNPLRAFDPFRSYWLTTLLVIAAIALPIALASCPKPPNGAAWLDMGAIVIAVLCLCLLPYATVKVGAKHHKTNRSAFWLLGIAHGAVQLVTPYLAAQLMTASLPSTPWSPLTGALSVILPWALFYVARQPFADKKLGRIVLLAGISVAGSLTLLYAGADGIVVHDDPLLVRLSRYAAGALVAMFLCTANLTWYFAIAGLLNGHNNEVGGAARVSKFRQIIRFRIDPTGLTGYVIRIEDAKDVVPVKHGNPKTALTFALVDVFSLKH